MRTAQHQRCRVAILNQECRVARDDDERSQLLSRSELPRHSRRPSKLARVLRSQLLTRRDKSFENRSKRFSVRSTHRSESGTLTPLTPRSRSAINTLTLGLSLSRRFSLIVQSLVLSFPAHYPLTKRDQSFDTGSKPFSTLSTHRVKSGTIDTTAEQSDSVEFPATPRVS